jgi:hypothetical protein
MSDQNRSQSSSSSLSSEIPNPGKKAKLLLQFTERLFHDVTEDYRGKVRPICRAMTPKDAFEFRVNSELAVNREAGGKDNCELNREGGKIDEDDGATRYDYILYYVSFKNSDGCVDNQDFISFVEDDDRYEVEWGDRTHDDDEASTQITLRVYKDDHKQNDK